MFSVLAVIALIFGLIILTGWLMVYINDKIEAWLQTALVKIEEQTWDFVEPGSTRDLVRTLLVGMLTGKRMLIFSNRKSALRTLTAPFRLFLLLRKRQLVVFLDPTSSDVFIRAAAANEYDWLIEYHNRPGQYMTLSMDHTFLKARNPKCDGEPLFYQKTSLRNATTDTHVATSN